MRLFAFGSNGSGQLGIGHQEDVSNPTQCLFTTDPESKNTTQDINEEITTIAAGGNHTLLLTKTGTVYAAGANTDGRCGTSTSPENVFNRVSITTASGKVDTFSHVSATWEGSIFVSSEATDDKVYVLGTNTKGELGVAEPLVSSALCVPDFPPRGTRVAALASGMAHSVTVLSNGDVWGWGGARKGQLGSENVVRIAGPVRIQVPFFAEEVVCGREFSVVSGRGQFVVLGDPGNRWGVLNVPKCFVSGEGGSRGLIRYPYEGIRASWHGIYVHAAGLESDAEGEVGSLIAWGRNDRGQIPPRTLPTPAVLAVGSEHVVALLKNGEVVACGWGEHGNCGEDLDALRNVADRVNLISLPETLEGKVVGVGAGCATSWMVVE
ncbi:unnamed protein product [Penicillium salamii]|uniref:RCC1-like domain-containing protein n=1 Tax=Penicillium salamii TaxID=1612424 RepID=A0A9W4JKG2_9EURO|nr:unnamed protein product [Penicillium salamii]CAG8403425.1 unnamed protein product [Penicillium salamii]CAG8413665.1 unnamed protein product [Penicillium salamii]CAG8414509.1 unnamed protein product [Penicillium salamii]